VNGIDPSGKMNVMVAVSISIGTGLVATAVSKFGFGFSWQRSLAIGASAGIGTMMILLPFTRILATTKSMSMPVFLAIKSLAFLSAFSGGILTTGSMFAIGLNIPSLFYNPKKANLLNEKWLNDFEKNFPKRFGKISSNCKECHYEITDICN
jgi:hypothetical protein